MNNLHVCEIALSIAVTLTATVPTVAQITVRDSTERPLVEERTDANDRIANRRPDVRNRANQQTTIRASQILGHSIVNTQNESVGEVNDLVLSPGNGRIRYAAVTYGGFAGIGDKMFAVPWQAFEFRPDPNDADGHVLVLNVTQKQLEGAQGFDQDNWPNFADRQFTSELDRRYGIERRPRRNRDGTGVDVRFGRGGVGVDVDADED